MKRLEQWKMPEYLKKLFHRYQYVLLVCGLGILLMLWPGGGNESSSDASLPAENAQENDTFLLEQQLQALLEQMDGVGRVQVMLTVKSSSESIYAYDKTENRSGDTETGELSRQSQLVTVTQNGDQIPVPRYQEGPTYQGAAVVCDGGGSPAVQLAVTKVVQSLTGISSDHIVISKMKQ